MKEDVNLQNRKRYSRFVPSFHCKWLYFDWQGHIPSEQGQQRIHSVPSQLADEHMSVFLTVLVSCWTFASVRLLMVVLMLFWKLNPRSAATLCTGITSSTSAVVRSEHFTQWSDQTSASRQEETLLHVDQLHWSRSSAAAFFWEKPTSSCIKKDNRESICSLATKWPGVWSAVCQSDGWPSDVCHHF